MRIPGLFDWSKTTFYTFGWNGTRGSTPYDEFSTVPTVAERSGNFSGLTDQNGSPIVIYNPLTGQPFADNPSTQVPKLLRCCITFRCRTSGTTQNYHYITSAEGIPTR